MLFMDRTCEGLPSVGVWSKRKRDPILNNVKTQDMPTKLFVGGIPFRSTEQDLRDMFGAVGEVVSVYVPMDRETGRPRGFAFVEMAEEAAADEAIKRFDGGEMGGRKIAVNKARPMEERAPRN